MTVLIAQHTSLLLLGLMGLVLCVQLRDSIYHKHAANLGLFSTHAGVLIVIVVHQVYPSTKL